MPCKHEKEPFGILPEYDGRCKLTQELRDKINDMYTNGYSIRAIARSVPILRRMIQFVLFPERYVKAKQQFKERRRDGRYYDAEMVVIMTQRWSLL